jgi:hypothetical protein
MTVHFQSRPANGCRRNEIPRIAEGKYLKLLYALHENLGTLEVSEVRRLCPDCICLQNAQRRKSSPFIALKAFSKKPRTLRLHRSEHQLWIFEMMLFCLTPAYIVHKAFLSVDCKSPLINFQRIKIDRGSIVAK